ncbi:MAG TPA: hypothetical protein VM802_07195 [Chitinophaga sp.]|uniref:hypothetical protein n=1 Tax=Chitinophaga sp. TaxID=1869181 RepID=UPI002C144876|nr:hypothetical protein [Chitinophaga sp.]HVI44636.1 hypothetical protein [Chitinophaga sp.]
MKAVKATYTVKASFAERNKENVAAALADLKRVNDPDLRYTVFIAPDGKTFMHFGVFKSDRAQQTLLENPVFKAFQQERDASGLEVEPVIEEVEYVASSFDLFS